MSDIQTFFALAFSARAFSISNFGQEIILTNAFVDFLIRCRQNNKLNENRFLPLRLLPVQYSIILPLLDAVTSEILKRS